MAGAAYEESPVAWAILAASVSLGLIYMLDQASGHPPGLMFLYVIPIWIAARLGDLRSGVGSVAATVLVLAVSDLRADPFMDRMSLVAASFLRAGTLTLAMFLIWTAEKGRKRAESAAMRDSLTDMFNRDAMRQFAKFALERTMRTLEPLSVVMVDCDNFKSANDEFGHLAGDRILALLASKLSSSVQPVGTVSRWGGDEFMIILPNTSAEQAENMMLTAQSHFETATEAFIRRMSFTFGIAQFGSNGFSLWELVQAADADMYRRKKHSGIRAVIASERLAS